MASGGGEKETRDGVDGCGGGVVIEVGECGGEERSKRTFDGWQSGGGDGRKRERVDFMEGVRIGRHAGEEGAIRGEIVDGGIGRGSGSGSRGGRGGGRPGWGGTGIRIGRVFSSLMLEKPSNRSVDPTARGARK